MSGWIQAAMQQNTIFVPNLGQKLSRLNKILCCLNIASLKKKKWIFQQSAAPKLAALAGAAKEPSAVGGAWACWDYI